MDKVNILMCCSKLSVKGGMVSVVRNYLGYKDWDKYNIIYIPTHTEKNKFVVMMYFVVSYVQIFLLALFGNIKIAHLHTAERGSFFRKAILVRTLRKFGIRTIMHHHAAEFEQFYSGLNKKKKEYVVKTLEMADLNIVLSKGLISMITDKAPMARIEVLYNAVPVYEKNPYNSNAKNILFLGRLGRRKGTYDLLSAISIIDKDLPEETKFYLCGDGEINEIRNEVKRLKIQHRVVHIGWIREEQKKEFLMNSCVNVLPSYNEGLPMSILETMAYGIPSITTNIGSIPEVVEDNVNGYLIEPGDINALADRIKDLVINKIKRDNFGQSSYNLIMNNFSLSMHITNLKGIYNNLVNR